MNYREKLRLAKEALDSDSYDKETIEYIFPELKEDEGEEIKKELIHYFSDGVEFLSLCSFSREEIIAWLEKIIIPNHNNIDYSFIEDIKNVIAETPLLMQSDKEKMINWLEKQGEVKESFILQQENKTCEKNSNFLTSEDERIRESLLEYLHTLPNHYAHSGVCAPEWIAWLEKQGEQKKSYDTCDSSMMDNKKSPCSEKRDFGYFEKKFTDKVEPRFHKGEWIIKNDGNECFSDGFSVVQVVEVNNGNYRLSNGNSLKEPFVDTYRLWNISDAKDGDVLSIAWHEGNNSWEKIIIFKKYHNKGVEGLFNSPCVEGYGNTFKNGKLVLQEEVPYYSKTWTSNLQPATKEQCDLLFQKMKEARYEWDAEKKEPKKIKQEFAELSEFDKCLLTAVGTIVKNPQIYEGSASKLEDFILSYSATLKKSAQTEQTIMEWSDEDEMNFRKLLLYLSCREKITLEVKSKYIAWLESLKQRIVL